MDVRRVARAGPLLSAIMAHNLHRVLQMSADKAERGTTEQRAPWWCFTRLGPLGMRLTLRTGRLTNPNGRLTLTLSVTPAVQEKLLHYLKGTSINRVPGSRLMHRTLEFTI